MLPSKNNFLDHVKWLRQAVQRQGAELIVAGDSMQALVRRGARHWALYPQFLAVVDGVSQYTPVMSDDVTHFAGWMPYRGKRWPLATDKLVFKRYASAQNLPVPAYSVDPDAEMSDVVVKRAASSFGQQVQGPFRQAAECPLKVELGDYCERFIEGRIVKAWFWNGEAVVMELDTMPRVAGDGASTLAELIERRARMLHDQSSERLQWFKDRCEVVLRYYGMALTTTLPAGTEQVIEFRYGSDLMNFRNRRLVDLRPGSDGRSNWSSLVAAGQALYLGIPEAIRADTLYTVDAIRDADAKVWLLEMNSNPSVHPMVYPAMLGSLLAMPAEPPPSGNAPTSQQPLVAV